jgi:ATP-dependent Clp protease protease subunit
MSKRSIADITNELMETNFDASTGTIFFFEDAMLNPHHASFLCKCLHILRKARKNAYIYLQSYGGDWYSGVAIFDAIRQYEGKVTMHVRGCAFSMGSVILQEAHHRVMDKNSVIMMHDGTHAFEGHTRDFEIQGKEAERIRKQMYEMISDRTQLHIAKVCSLCQFDKFLTPEDCLELNLIDEIK